MKDEKSEITAELLAFIHKYSENQNLGESYERAFNALALKLFTYQFKHNLAYKKLCQSKRKSPLTVKHWRDIPPMPLQGFKELTLSCTPVEEAEAVFMTSGTTNPEKRGRNYHPNLTTWDASMRAPFKEFVLPDRENMTIFVLSPAEDMNQQSSLSRYLTNALKYFGTERSESFFHEDGLEMERLVDALRESERREEAVLLMGASFAYVHFLDYCKTHQLHFSLPEGSRIFDTGGFKGQSREVSPEALIQDYAQYFHVDENLCINMYGMTELCSQFYDQTIQSNALSDRVIHDKKGPAWIKTQVLDTNTLEPLPIGQVGVLAHYDLANWNACVAILTEDLGYLTENGFVLLGRVKGSEARGCSVAVDQLLQSNQH